MLVLVVVNQIPTSVNGSHLVFMLVLEILHIILKLLLRRCELIWVPPPPLTLLPRHQTLRPAGCYLSLWWRVEEYLARSLMGWHYQSKLHLRRSLGKFGTGCCVADLMEARSIGIKCWIHFFESEYSAISVAHSRAKGSAVNIQEVLRDVLVGNGWVLLFCPVCFILISWVSDYAWSIFILLIVPAHNFRISKYFFTCSVQLWRHTLYSYLFLRIGEQTYLRGRSLLTLLSPQVLL